MIFNYFYLFNLFLILLVYFEKTICVSNRKRRSTKNDAHTFNFQPVNFDPISVCSFLDLGPGRSWAQPEPAFYQVWQCHFITWQPTIFISVCPKNQAGKVIELYRPEVKRKYYKNRQSM